MKRPEVTRGASRYLNVAPPGAPIRERRFGRPAPGRCNRGCGLGDHGGHGSGRDHTCLVPVGESHPPEACVFIGPCLRSTARDLTVAGVGALV